VSDELREGVLELGACDECGAPARDVVVDFEGSEILGTPGTFDFAAIIAGEVIDATPGARVRRGCLEHPVKMRES
jgi:hypothetical protein